MFEQSASMEREEHDHAAYAKRVIAIDDYTTKVFDYVGGDNPIYIGWAQPGSSKSDAVWRIQKLTYSGNNVTDIQWANGVINFNSIWDNRASLTYS